MLDQLKLWLDPIARNGPEAMAVDEWLLETSADPILRIYQWSGCWGSLGYFGNHSAAAALIPEVDWVRRWTGGGLVDHRNDWTYTMVIPNGQRLARLKGAASYEIIHAVLADVLNKEGRAVKMSSGDMQTGAPLCFQNPVSYDIVTPSGEKIAGAGQRRSRGGLLHQGSVSFGLENDQSEVRGRDLAMAFCNNYIEQEFNPPTCRIQHLVESRYSNDSWTSRR